MISKYKLAIFDLDGTVLDTLEDLADSTNYALRVCGHPERTIDEVRRFVGNGIGKLIERAVPANTSEQEKEHVFSEFTSYYKIHSADKTRPYEGIMEVLAALKNAGIKTAIVSNKADFAVQDLCRYYFRDCFDYAVGERKGIQRKPSPDSVNEVLACFNIRKEEAVYIGDSEVDIATAENAQMDSIIVTWGFRKEDFLRECGAEILAGSPGELLKYF